MLTLAHKAQLSLFSQPFLALQSPFCTSSVLAGTLFSVPSSTAPLLQHCHFGLFFICLLLLSRVSLSQSALPRVSAPIWARERPSLDCTMARATVVLSQPRIPSDSRALDITNTGRCFQTLFQQENSPSLTRTSQTG